MSTTRREIVTTCAYIADRFAGNLLTHDVEAKRGTLVVVLAREERGEHEHDIFCDRGGVLRLEEEES